MLFANDVSNDSNGIAESKHESELKSKSNECCTTSPTAPDFASDHLCDFWDSLDQLQCVSAWHGSLDLADAPFSDWESDAIENHFDDFVQRVVPAAGNFRVWPSDSKMGAAMRKLRCGRDRWMVRVLTTRRAFDGVVTQDAMHFRARANLSIGTTESCVSRRAL